MEILYLIIPLSVFLVFLIGVVFWWSVRSGQFDDLEGPGYRILMDDDLPQAGPPLAEGGETAERGNEDDLTHVK
ncbi:MAG TPA: cbb3-type cytochrome oxidase assembly protein CcoS [Candidatus Desulfobacillus sp.]|nr:cbb3-type cytochrome oxidase assembly protein CcoS [Candidatus Desulfobacillus sp.]